MRLSAHQPCLHETLHSAETADIHLGEVLPIGVVGSRFEVGTDLGPEVLCALAEVLKLVAEHVRRHGERAELRTQPLPVKDWRTSEQRV
jgi:hypothetical protein